MKGVLRMKKGRMIFTILLLTFLFSLTAFAGSPKATYSWSTSSGGSYTSDDALKSDTANADVYPQGGTNYSSGIYYNVKQNSNTVAGGATRYNLTSFNLTYKSGKAIANKYYNLYLKTSTAGTVIIGGYWYP